MCRLWVDRSHELLRTIHSFLFLGRRDHVLAGLHPCCVCCLRGSGACCNEADAQREGDSAGVERAVRGSGGLAATDEALR